MARRLPAAGNSGLSVRDIEGGAAAVEGGRRREATGVGTRHGCGQTVWIPSRHWSEDDIAADFRLTLS